MEDCIGIPLSGKRGQGKFMLIDEQDAHLFVGRKVCLGRDGYPRATIEGRCGLVHRFIMGAQPGQILDHVNQNRLDNRRSNLRFCTRGQNNCNVSSRGASSGYKGVSWSKRDRVWRAEIAVDGRRIRLGSFANLMQAVEVYDAAARQYHKEFASTNLPEPSSQFAVSYLAALNEPKWRITSPSGEIYHVINVSEFCRQHGLSSQSLGQVALGKASRHKGWKCEYISIVPRRRARRTDPKT